MNNFDKNYLALLQDIKDNGYEKGDRTGTGSRAVFGRQIRHRMKDGFPLLTTKQMHFKGIAAELLWFLSGDTNIQALGKQNVNIWHGDAYKKYKNTVSDPILSPEEFKERIKTNNMFASMWGDLGPIYGHQWRSWDIVDETQFSSGMGGLHVVRRNSIDQINNVINTLKTNPESRQNIVNAWNVADIHKMTLPPCHTGFQFDARKLTFEEKIQWVMNNTNVELENVAITEAAASPSTPSYELSLCWNQRSVDTPLGLPYNIASYAILLQLICKEVNMIPGDLIGSLGNTHIYNNQFDGVEMQLDREGSKFLPSLKIKDSDKPLKDNMLLSNYSLSDLVLTDYNCNGSIPYPLSN